MDLDEKFDFAETAFQSTNRQMRAHYYRQGFHDEVISSLRLVTTQEALETAEAPAGYCGDKVISAETLIKLQNYLRRYDVNVQTYIADFGMSGLGDDAASFVAIFNARTGWITYVQFAEYSE